MGGQGLERETNLTENTQKIKSESARGINIGEGGHRDNSVEKNT